MASCVGTSFRSLKSGFKKVHLRALSTLRKQAMFEGGEEIRIPVPWGHISGQWWGDKNQQPLLAITGWLDNIGTLIPLVSELSKKIPIVCIEWPGQGYSSRFPKGFHYYYDNSVTVLHFVLRHFNWPTVSILGHSLGANGSFAYASLFPNKVKLLVAIEGLLPPPTKHENFLDLRSTALETNCEMDLMQDQPREMSYEQAKKQIAKFLPIPENLLDWHLARELRQNGEKYYFATDPRQRIRGQGYAPEVVLQMAETVRCPILYFKGTQFPYVEGKTFHTAARAILEKKRVYVKQVDIDGSHFIHLTHSTELLPYIQEFLDEFE